MRTWLWFSPSTSGTWAIRFDEPSLYCLQLFHFSDTPSAPGKPQITDVTKRSAKLTWTPCTNDGGSPLLTYVVEQRILGGFKWQRANPEKLLECSYTVTGLKEDTEYEFRVAGENKAGIGGYAEATMVIRAKDPFGKLKYFNAFFIFSSTRWVTLTVFVPLHWFSLPVLSISVARNFLVAAHWTWTDSR